MKEQDAAASWFEIPEARSALAGEPLTMQEAWLEQVGPVRCEQCGHPIEVGERFRLRPYCPMGGHLDLAPEALTAFADALEVSARHVACAVGGRPHRPNREGAHSESEPANQQPLAKEQHGTAD